MIQGGEGRKRFSPGGPQGGDRYWSSLNEKNPVAGSGSGPQGEIFYRHGDERVVRRGTPSVGTIISGPGKGEKRIRALIEKEGKSPIEKEKEER